MFDKDTISRIANIGKSELIIASPARYFGGILNHPTKKFEIGSIGITNNSIIFVKDAILAKNKITINIPFNKVIFPEISEVDREDLDSGNLYTAASYFAEIWNLFAILTFPFWASAL